MLKASIPTRFQKAWAVSAAGAYIRTVPVASQIGIQDGAASFTDGFVPVNFAPLAGGGVPPYGQDMNGALNIQTSWDIWYQAGAPISYDLTFSTAQGGYPQGAKVDSSIVTGAQWYSLVDSNTTDPDDPLTSTNWARVGIPVGTPTPFFSSTVPDGFVAMNAGTIGNAASGAGYANAKALFLFCYNWLQFSNTQCPILTSAGAASTRGANAVADWLANKRLTLPDGRGLGLIGVDTMGGAASTNLAGVTVISGNTTTPGSVLGANLQGLTIPNLPIVTPAGSVVSTVADIVRAPGGLTSSGAPGGGNIQLNGLSGVTGSITSTFSGTPIGSNTAHNNVSLTMAVYWGQKL